MVTMHDISTISRYFERDNDMYIGQYKMRWMFFVIGLLVMGFGVALTIRGKQFGLGGWDVFHYGLWKQFGLSIGLWSIIVGISIILFTVAVTKTLPKMGVYMNMFLFGMFIDIFNYILPEVHGFWFQLIVYVAGVVILAFGIALYITPQLGAGPRDTFMLLIIDKTGLSLSTARTLMEVIVMFAGWLLGGPVSLGTLFITFMLGPMIQRFMPVTKRLIEIWVKPATHKM